MSRTRRIGVILSTAHLEQRNSGEAAVENLPREVRLLALAALLHVDLIEHVPEHLAHAVPRRAELALRGPHSSLMGS